MTVEERVLGDVGVGPDAEDVYRVLLADPGLSASELAERVEFGRSRLRFALAELERLAIVSLRWEPSPVSAGLKVSNTR